MRNTLLATTLAALTLSGCEWLPWHPEPDAVAPRVILAAPAGGATTRDDSVRVTGTARDSAGAVARVLYALGTGAEREVPATPGREVSFAFTVTGLAPGSNTITVYAIDERGNRGSASVTVTYQPLRPPLARNDSASSSGSRVVVPVLRNDSSPDGRRLHVRSITWPSSGTAVLNADGTVTYTPTRGWSGADTFHYTVDDGTELTAGATVTVAVSAGTPPGPYTVHLLPRSGVVGLNDRGQVLTRTPVAGSATEYEYFVWENGAERSLGRTVASRLNDAGEYVSAVCTRESATAPRGCTEYGYGITRVGETSPPSPVGDHRTPTPELGVLLNDARQVVLGGDLWEGSTRTPLTLSDGRAVAPLHLNDRGEVLGSVKNGEGRSYVIWRKGSPATVLNALANFSVTGFNDHGQVVGYTYDPSGAFTVFLWENGARRDIMHFLYSGPSPIHLNNAGLVTADAGHSREAYVWKDGERYTLQSLLLNPSWKTGSVVAINHVGQLVSTAVHETRGTRSTLLLTPRAP